MWARPKENIVGANCKDIFAPVALHVFAATIEGSAMSNVLIKNPLLL